MTIGFPLLLIPLAIYNIVVFLMPGVSFTAALTIVPLLSGAGWPMTFGDLLLAFSLLLLLFEVVKAARPGAKYLTDHLLSLLVFAAALAEFLLLAPFGTSAFFLLTALMAVDFLAGVAGALRHRKYRAVDDVPADDHDIPHADPPQRPIADHPAGVWTQQPLPREAVRPEPPRPVTPVTPATAPVSPVAVPPIEKISPAVHETSSNAQKSGRKISEWSVADLVRDTDHAPTTKPSLPAEKPPSAN